MIRRTFLLGFGTSSLLGQEQAVDAAVRDVIGGMANALSSGDIGEFLKPIDRAMPDYARLRTLTAALLDQADVSASVDFLDRQANGDRLSLELDWLLVLTSKTATGEVERRRTTVRIGLERNGSRWRVTSLSPVDFFGPPQFGRSTKW
jgi:hypothetical protein